MSERRRALLGRLGALRGALGKQALKSAPEQGWRAWRPGDPEIERVFLSHTWFRLKAPTEGRLDLTWAGDGPTARLTVRDNWIPGAFRQWEVMAEPQAEAPIDQPALLRDLITLARANGVDELFCFSNMARWVDPSVEGLFAEGAEPFGTYLAPVAADDAAQRLLLHKKHRYQLKQAEKAGVEIREGVAADLFADMMQRTYARGGKDRPFSPDYLGGLLAAERALPLIVRSAWHAGACQAVVVAPYDEQRGYYLHGASAERPVNGAAVLAHMAVFDRLRALGVPHYDLGGARAETADPRLEGIFRFKRRFGGEFEACTRFRFRLTDRPKVGQRLLDAWRAR